MAKIRRPTRKELDASVRRTDSFLNRSIQLHRKRLEDAIVSLEIRVVKNLASLKTLKGHRLRSAKANLKIAQKIHVGLTQHFLETYGRTVRSNVKDFDKIAARIKRSCVP